MCVRERELREREKKAGSERVSSEIKIKKEDRDKKLVSHKIE